MKAASVTLGVILKQNLKATHQVHFSNPWGFGQLSQMCNIASAPGNVCYTLQNAWMQPPTALLGVLLMFAFCCSRNDLPA